MSRTYTQTRDRLEAYFDRTASATWERLTSDAPVSRIRQTVREGRDQMRAALLAQLPTNLRHMRVLDAGCGAGQMAIELAERGADVVAVDISPSLLNVARQRTPRELVPQINYVEGDFAGDDLGIFDCVVAMDSLIHYRATDIALALEQLAGRTREKIVFTIAPKTPLLGLMHFVGKAFPRSDRSPAIEPITKRALTRALGHSEHNHPDHSHHEQSHPEQSGKLATWRLESGDRIARGFYISQAMELRR